MLAASFRMIYRHVSLWLQARDMHSCHPALDAVELIFYSRIYSSASAVGLRT